MWPRRQGRSRDRRKADRLADQSAAGLLEHQSEFGEAEAKTIQRCREQECQAIRVPRLPQPRRTRSLDPARRNPRATFGPAAAMNFAALSRSRVCSDVRCRSMRRSALSVSLAGSAHGEPARCAEFPTSRRRSSRGATAETAPRHRLRRNSVAIGSSRRRVTARGFDQQIVERLEEFGSENLDDRRFRPGALFSIGEFDRMAEQRRQRRHVDAGRSKTILESRISDEPGRARHGLDALQRHQ